MKLKKLARIAPVICGSLLLTNPVLAANGTQGFKLGMAVDQGLGVVIKFEDQFNLFAGNDGMAFDYLFSKGKFDSDVPFDWYVGAGAWVEWSDDFGVRVPLGIDWDFSPGWNAYAQVSPELQIHDDAKFKFGGALGVTYSF